MLRYLFSLLIIAFPHTVFAVKAEEPIQLEFPLACTLGENCWAARYASRGGDKKDYACMGRTQIGHNGTDFSLTDLTQMQTGIPVRAAAKGIVINVRNTEPDISVKLRGTDAIDGKECGNGIFLEHENGWSTQYCHMKQGSITVNPGDTVEAGATIGEVGLSGETEYPHLHFNVRKNGNRIDPFDGQPTESACNPAGAQGLWKNPIAYSPVAFVTAAFTVNPPTRTTIWDAAPEMISAEAPSLVLSGRVFGLKAGDTWSFSITQPDGKAFFKHEITFDKSKQFHFQFGGKKRPRKGFMPGLWKGDITIMRDGVVLSAQYTSITIQ